MIAIRCVDLRCHRPEWTYGPSRVDGISLELEEGVLHGFRGEKRSGKTLLLHLLGLLEARDGGTIQLFDEAIEATNPGDNSEIRNAVFGYLFPSPCLLPAFTIAENVAMPLFRFSDPPTDQVRQRVAEILGDFDLQHLATEIADHLSLADQHKVALARALIHRPRILVAIQPPPEVHALLRRCVDTHGLTCLWSGSGDNQPTGCDREITLAAGRVLQERIYPS